MGDLHVYAIQFLIFLASFIFLKTIITRARNKDHLPPGPIALPVIGHMHLLGPIVHQSFHKLSMRYGPLVHIFIGSIPCAIASTAEVAKEILQENESNFMDRPKTTNLDYLTYGSNDLSTIPYGPHWKFMKKFSMIELLGTRTLDNLLPVRREELKQFLNKIFRKAETKEAVNIGEELTRLTNNTISRMIFGSTCSSDENEADEMRNFVKEYNLLGGQFNLSDSIWFCKGFDLQGLGKRLKDARDRYDVMIERIIREHEEARKKKKEIGAAADDTVKDMLDLLLDIHEDENSERKLTKVNIKSFVISLFAAGTDTSSASVEWALSELINHPNIMKKARQEIDSIVGKNRLVEESDIPNLPYLQSVVKETLRLHPPGPIFFRQAIEDCTISGYKIPAKTWVYVNVWSLGRDPNYWNDPLVFRPERFSSEAWDAKNNMLEVRGQNFNLLPFGSGRRSCPGASLALQFVPTALAALIQCFDWKVGDGDMNTKVDMEEGSGLGVPKKNPLICSPVPRFTPFLST